MENTNFIEIIKELNIILYEQFDETEVTFEYRTNGFVDIITLAGIDIWDSEHDDREWNEEVNDYEPFLPFIKREFNKRIDKLNSLKFADE